MAGLQRELVEKSVICWGQQATTLRKTVSLEKTAEEFAEVEVPWAALFACPFPTAVSVTAVSREKKTDIPWQTGNGST